MFCCFGKPTDSDSDSFQGKNAEKTQTNPQLSEGSKTPAEVQAQDQSVKPVLGEAEVKKEDIQPVNQPILEKSTPPQEAQGSGEGQQEPPPSSQQQQQEHGSESNAPVLLQEIECEFVQEEIEKLNEEVRHKKAEILRAIEDGETDIMSQESLLTAVNRLEAVATRLESLASKAPSSRGSSAEPEAVSASVKEYDATVMKLGDDFVGLSNKIGGDVQTMGGLVKKLLNAQRAFLDLASKSKKPSANDLNKVVQPMSSVITEITEFKDNHRRSTYFNHLSGVAEAIGAFGWVLVEPTPGPYVKDMAEAGQFYTNRVLREYKEKDTTHVDWVKCWTSIFQTLQAYIKNNHTTGVTWNPKGGDATAVKSGGAPPPPPPGGAPPPPPPPPPVEAPSGGPSSGGDDDAGRAALFAELNKGTDITKGLKKVTDNMKTHKNPALRQGPAPFKAAVPPKTAPKPSAKPVAAPAVSHPPVFELRDKKWIIEYHRDNRNLVIDAAEIKHTVYIYKCEKCTVVVKGKVNSITLDSCKKSAIVFDDVVSSLEVINCQSIQGQVMGKTPTVTVDKTDGFQMYLSKESLNAEIVSAKSSEMNVLVPKADGDFSEFPLPEQFKTTWDGSKFVTVCADI